MTQFLIDIASWVFIGIGSFFVVAGAIAILRMPDVFTRIHGASVIDTAGAGFLILGMMLQVGFSLVLLKLVFILAVFLFTLPVAAHALAQAVLHEGIKPQLVEDRSASAQGDGRQP
ncbi:MAG: monovalent cation/H(+) antiporter subunit G [Xanthobacteraceae bacterium]